MNPYQSMHYPKDPVTRKVLFQLLYGGQIIRRNLEREQAYAIRENLKKNPNYRMQTFEIKPQV